MNAYPTKIVTARIMTEFMGQSVLFTIGATELHVDASEEKAREVIADRIAYQMHADKSQRLYQGNTIEEITASLLSDMFEWQLFTNKLN